MSKAVEVLASGLYIERCADQDQPDGEETTTAPQKFAVSEETRKIFQEKLMASLNEEFGKNKRGWTNPTVQYAHYLGSVRGASLHLVGAKTMSTTENLEKVMKELPELEEGYAYRLPVNTYIWFKIDEQGDIAVNQSKPICPWIKRLLAAK